MSTTTTPITPSSMSPTNSPFPADLYHSQPVVSPNMSSDALTSVSSAPAIVLSAGSAQLPNQATASDDSDNELVVNIFEKASRTKLKTISFFAKDLPLAHTLQDLIEAQDPKVS